MSIEKDKEFSEEELMNVFGGFELRPDSEHPFNDQEIYGESQKEKLQRIKEELQQLEQSDHTKSDRRR